MRFLADESCNSAVVRALRAAGHDVSDVRDIAPGCSDDAVLNMALLEHRTLLTEDKDFGALVFAGDAAPFGVILLRWPHGARSDLARCVLEVVALRSEVVPGSFVVVEPGGVRITQIPDDG